MSTAGRVGRRPRPSPRTPVGTARDPRRSGAVRVLALVATFLIGTIVVLLRDVLLPARFSFDAKGIQAIGQGTLHVVDPAFESVAQVYRVLGLIDAPVAAGLLGYVAAFAVLVVAGRRLLRPDSPLSATLLFLVAALLAAVYLGTYSKDVFVLPVALLAVLPGGRLRWPLLTGLAIIGYAVVFRTYWFVVLGVWLGLQVVLVKRPRPAWLLAAMLLAAALLAAAIGVALGESADLFRSAVNEGRAGSDDASSTIDPIVPGGTVLTGLVNTPLALLSLLVPLPLVLKGGLYFLVLAVALAVFWARTGVAIGRTLRTAPDAPERSRIALLLAFVTVQALFEPDYGSALRHLTPMLPVAVLLWSRPRALLLRAAAPTRIPTLRS